MIEFRKLVEEDIIKIKGYVERELGEHGLSIGQEGYHFYIPEDKISQLYKYGLLKNEDITRTERRNQLFREEFLGSDWEQFDNSSISWYMSKIYNWFSIEDLLVNLYVYLINKILNNPDQIQNLLEMCRVHFDKFKLDERLPLQIWVYLEGLKFEKSVKINSKFELIFIDFQCIIKRFSGSVHNYEYPYLVYNTEVQTRIEKLSNDDIEINEEVEENGEWEENWYEINKLLFSFYLNGLIFTYKTSIIKPPWWISEDSSNPRIYSDDQKIFKPNFEELFNLYSECDIENKIGSINEIADLIEKSNIMKNPNYILLINRYFQIFARKSSQDRILDEFIILESIFTSSNVTEIRFRLSLNIASFLAENQQEFNEICKFIKDIYSIRSSIVHGEEWKKRLKGKKIFKHFELDNIHQIAEGIFIRLKEMIDKSILRIMEWEIKNNKLFINEAKDLFFLNYYMNNNLDQA
ncbi:MAG: hypothetical protein ACFFDH_04475 [Promethearchaeota archaeon]